VWTNDFEKAGNFYEVIEPSKSGFYQKLRPLSISTILLFKSLKFNLKNLIINQN
jgi:hypothetical protein